MNKSKAAIFSPIFVICIGFVVAYTSSRIINEWAFIPLALTYWAVIFTVSYRAFGKEGIIHLFGKSEGKTLWFAVLSIVVGLIPLSIFLLNLELLNSPLLIAIWLAFAAINPIIEEIYWRGYLLETLPFSKKVSVFYSTLFFVLIHPLVWGVFSIGNRSWMTWVSLSIMGVVWSIVYLKTKSLRWPTISHIMVNLFNLSVFVFLNIYVPHGM